MDQFLEKKLARSKKARIKKGKTKWLDVLEFELSVAEVNSRLIGLDSVLSQVGRIKSEIRRGCPALDLRVMLRDLRNRVLDQLQERNFFFVPDDVYYLNPFENWPGVADQVSDATQDIEEAGKSFAFERYGAAVFYLMRVAEYGAIELGKLAGSTDPRPTFGSSLDLIVSIVQKTKFSDLSLEVQKHFDFLQSILPQMYAVKNAWRNKVDHAGGRIIPTESQPSREVAVNIYSATATLMHMLATELSKRTAPILN